MKVPAAAAPTTTTLTLQILADVAELKATLASTEKKKADLEGQALKTTDQLKRAEQLIGGLGDERERWQESADRLSKDLKNLVGNVMLASGCLAYLGPFTRYVISTDDVQFSERKSTGMTAATSQTAMDATESADSR